MTIFVEMCGGLGNQLFLMSYAITASKKYNHKVVLDLDRYSNDSLRKFELGELCNYLNIEIGRASSFCHQIPAWRKTHNALASFGLGHQIHALTDVNPVINGDIQSKEDFIFQGYAQNLLYTDGAKEELRRFYLDKPQTKDYVLVHLRRGDYLISDAVNLRLGITSEEMLLRGVSYVRTQLGGKLHAVVVSDSPDIGSLFAERLPNSSFFDTSSFSPSELLKWMMNARAYVLSNSTLGWWSAYLSSPDVVVGPSNWFAGDEATGIQHQDWIWI